MRWIRKRSGGTVFPPNGHDQLATGTRIRVLTIVDTFSRYAPAIVPRFSFRAPDVIEVLERLGAKIGLPRTIRVELPLERHGSERQWRRQRVHLP